jgi:ceramide glucosyltransferase
VLALVTHHCESRVRVAVAKTGRRIECPKPQELELQNLAENSQMKFFLIPAALLFVQSVVSLVGGLRFLRLIRKNRARPAGGYQPPVALIIPCKGVDNGFKQNVDHFLSQDYPRYEVVFVVASEDDPAYKCLAEATAQAQHPVARANPKQNIVVAGYSDTNGEKVHNLLAGLAAVDPQTEVLAFADVDARPSGEWLRFLVAPLESHDVTVSTGYRWYLPSASLASRLRAAWDTSIATMMGEHGHNFAWGGSMAIRAADFTRMKIAEQYWQGTVSDDYAITRAAREAGGKIRFESRCLVASQEDSTFAEFLEWANRQIIITRIYATHYWYVGLASYGLYALTFIWGLALLILPGVAPSSKMTTAALLAGILIFGMLKGATRTVAAREIFPSERSSLDRYGSCYWQLTPLIPWVMLYNFLIAALQRRIEWRGTVYELRSRNELHVVSRRQW